MLLNESFFNEFTIKVPGNAAALVEALAARGLLAGVPVARLEPTRPALANLIIVAATELNTPADRHAYVRLLKEALAC